MDDFYTSMAEAGALEPLNKNVELQQNNINTDSSSLLFVDALVPLNPARWGSFTAGSAAGSDMPDLSGKLGTPFANLQVAQEYLATAQSDVQYRDRLWKVAEDTITINASCELGGDIGSFSAGAMSDQIADNYMNEMVETELTKNLNEKLNMEIFRATAKDNQRELETVHGTGTIRQNVPDYLQGDLCDRPKRNARPSEWWSTGGLDEPGLGSGPLKPNSPDGRPSSDSIKTRRLKQ